MQQFTSVLLKAVPILPISPTQQTYHKPSPNKVKPLRANTGHF